MGDIAIRPVTCAQDLALWQQVSADGWGHHASDSRRASDAFAAAAFASDDEHFLIAYDALDGRPLGAAAISVCDRAAMLGGMSTLVTERRRGVQSALIRYRLAMAAELGCDLALATAARGGDSERNLCHRGFEPLTTIRQFRRPSL